MAEIQAKPDRAEKFEVYTAIAKNLIFGGGIGH